MNMSQYQIVMTDLQNDLKIFQGNVVSWIGEYDKLNRQLVQLQFNNKLQGLLEGIAEFDHQKIKNRQSGFSDLAVGRYIADIAQKIRGVQQRMVERKEEVRIDEEGKNSKKELLVNQEQPKERKHQKKEESFFSSVLSKLTKKQKKSSQIILPESEPNVIYDPVTRSYIFQGQQPEAPKQIPKPPSKSQLKRPSDDKKQKGQTGESSEEALTAPPAFRRKSTATSKSKIKMQQSIKIVEVEEQPMTYDKLMQKINAEYYRMLQKVSQGLYQNMMVRSNVDESQHLQSLIQFTEQILQYSEDISKIETNLIKKWNNLTVGENKQLKLIEKVVKQLGQSNKLYDQTFSKLDHQINIQNSKQQQQQQQIMNVQIQLEILSQKLSEKEMQILQLREELKNQTQSTQQKDTRIHNKQQRIQQQQNLIITLQKNLQNINDKSIQLKIDLELLKNTNQQLQLRIDQATRELNAIVNQKRELKLLADQQIKRKDQINNKLRLDNKELNAENDQLKRRVSSIEAQLQNRIQAADALMKQQIGMMSTHLKLSHQKYTKYLGEVQQLQLTQQQRSQQNQLINLQPIPQDSINIGQLSQCIKKYTQNHLDIIHFIVKSYTQAHQQYHLIKDDIQHLKQFSIAESSVLSKSVTRLKVLAQTYKTLKEEAEEKSAALKLQCDKLRKKLKHYREQQEFNRSYLSKLKISNVDISNESMISLQSDNEELVQKLDQMQKQIHLKNYNLTKLQTDLEDILSSYQKDQSRQLETEKRVKEYEREMRLIKQQTLQLTNQIRLLELKLLNQKQKYQEQISKEEMKIRNIQSTCDKKYKIIKQELEQSLGRQDSLKEQISQIQQQVHNRIKGLQEFHLSKQKQLDLLVEKGKSQIQYLLMKIQQKDTILEQLQMQMERVSKYNKEILLHKQQQNSAMNRLIDQQKLQIQHIQQSNNEAMQQLQLQQSKITVIIEQHNHDKQMLANSNKLLADKQQQLKLKMTAIIDEHLKQIAIMQQQQDNMNQIIAAMLQKYKSYKQDQEQFKAEYQIRMKEMQDKLFDNAEENRVINQQLLEQIRNYEAMINKQTQFIGTLQAVSRQSSTELQSMREEHDKLKQLVQFLQQQITTKSKQTQQHLKDSQQYKLDNLQKTTELVNLRRQIRQKEEVIALKLEEIKQLNERIYRDDIQLQSVNRKVEMLDEELNMQYSEKQMNTEDVASRNIVLESQIIQLRIALEFKENQNCSLMDNIGILNEQLQKKMQETKGAYFNQEQIQQYAEQIKLLNQTVLSLNSQIQQKNQTIQQLRQTQQKLKHVQSVQKHTISAVNCSQPSLNYEQLIKEYNMANANLKQQTNKSKQLIKQYQMANDNLQQQINQSKLKMQQLQESNKQKLDQIVELQHSIELHTIIVSQFQTDLNLIMNQLKQNQQNQLQYKQKINQLQRNSVQAQVEIAQLIKDNNQYMKQNQSKDLIIAELRCKLDQKDQETAKIEEQKSIQIEAEIQGLQKVIEEKENQLSHSQLSAKQAKCLFEKYKQRCEEFEESEMYFNKQLETKQFQIDNLKAELVHLEQRYIHKNQLLEKDKVDLTDIIGRLERQIQEFRPKSLINVLSSEQQIKQSYETRVSNLIKYNQDKDIVIAQLQQQINQRNTIIEKLEANKRTSDNLIRDFETRLNLTNIEPSIEDDLFFSNQKVREDLMGLTKCDKIVTDSMNFHKQQSQLMKVDEKIEEFEAGEKIKQQLPINEENQKQFNQMQKKQKEIILQFEEKQAAYKSQIQNLLTQIANLTALEGINKSLEDNIKSLELENTTLTNQKIQLLRSNSYLMDINQKLVGSKSHHYEKTKIVKPAPKSQIIEPTNFGQKSQVKLAKSQIIEEQTESKGFFGSLSSFFLTPTERERLVKK